MSDLPPRPDFEAIEAVAESTSERRTAILALIGNLVFSWSNNESLFIYVLMLLLRTDQASAAIVFVTLNTTRARLDLIRRLARAKVPDRIVMKELEALMDRFDRATRARNEFNHCTFTLNERGEITHTQSMRVIEKKRGLTIGEVRAMDDARLAEMREAVAELRSLNRDLWEFLPRLEARMKA